MPRRGLHPIGPSDDPARATAYARGDKPFEEYAQGTIVGTAEAIRERAQPLINLGLDYFIMGFPGWRTTRRRWPGSPRRSSRSSPEPRPARR